MNFMKNVSTIKKIAIASACLLSAQGAFASKARLEAFSESQYGSFVFDDYRNIYLNMAAINDYKNYATVELGKNSYGNDSAAQPGAEGGMTFAGPGSLVYGIHFGYTSALARDTRSAILGVSDLSAVTVASGTTKDLSLNDVVDFMVGGATDTMKWGAALQYGSSTDETGTDINTKQSAAAVRLGMIMNNFSLGANVGVHNKVELDALTIPLAAGLPSLTKENAEYKGKLGIEITSAYKLLPEFNLFTKIQLVQAEGTNAFLSEIDHKMIELGASKIYKFSDTNFMFAKIAAVYVAQTLTLDKQATLGLTTENEIEKTQVSAPITIGAEGQAREWLKLRASIKQNLMGTSELKSPDNALVEGFAANLGQQALGKKSMIGSTEVNAGATLVFGALDIDAMVSGINSSNQKTGTVKTSRVALTYKF